MATVVMAQPAIRTDVTGDLPGKRAESNVRNAQYPRLLPDNRAVFRVKAPEAQKVQIDLGRKYDMTREADGTWTCTTDPLSEGFHYYFLIVDGVKVADPASESFYGCSMMSSGIEVPYPDGKNVFELADVPHGDIRMNRYFRKRTDAGKGCLYIRHTDMNRGTGSIRCFTCCMVAVKTNGDGPRRDVRT